MDRRVQMVIELMHMTTMRQTTLDANNPSTGVQESDQETERPAAGEPALIGDRLAAMSEAATSRAVLDLLCDIYRLMQIGLIQLALSEDERPAHSGGEARGCEITVSLNRTRLTIRTPRALSAPATIEVRAYARLAVARLEAINRRAVARGHFTRRPTADYEQWCEIEIGRLARSPYNLMITGERGTGKTRLARLIHKSSPRAGGEFIEFNSAALPEHLAEAQLFGYRKGAYTGAGADTAGLFEAATGGTIFLDEVAELTPALQAKLLKAVEERRIRRIGETRERTVDMRIIAATSRDLAVMVEAGTFRADLYDRLATLKFETLPLRERRGEIPALVERFFSDAAADTMRATGRRTAYTIEHGALELLCGGEWAGNIRALRNSVLELTSYIEDERPITVEEVQRQLAKIGGRPSVPEVATTATQIAAGQSVEPELTLSEGDIVLPAEARVIKRGETLDDWLDRWTLVAIEAAQKDAGKEGKWARAGWRLSMSGMALKQRDRHVARRLERRGKVAHEAASQTNSAWLPYEAKS